MSADQPKLTSISDHISKENSTGATNNSKGNDSLIHAISNFIENHEGMVFLILIITLLTVCYYVSLA